VLEACEDWVDGVGGVEMGLEMLFGVLAQLN
jgi:hypothetical protein